MREHAPTARRSLEAGFTQPRAHLLADPCTPKRRTYIHNDVGCVMYRQHIHIFGWPRTTSIPGTTRSVSPLLRELRSIHILKKSAPSSLLIGVRPWASQTTISWNSTMQLGRAMSCSNLNCFLFHYEKVGYKSMVNCIHLA